MPTTTSATGRRWPTRVLAAVVMLVLLLVFGVAWYFADQLTLPPTVRPFEPDNELVAIEPGEVAGELIVTLRDEGFATQGQRWGLQLPNDRYLQLVEPLGVTATGVHWRAVDSDDANPTVGEPVRVDEYAVIGDPSDVGLAFVELELTPGDDLTGVLPTWFVPALDGVPLGTVIYVHGRGATREESLRFLPALHAAGWEIYVQTYRGDEGAPAYPDDRLRYGATEWADIDSTLARVQQDGADGPTVLFGASMGGSLIAQTMDRSELADTVDAVILDSPLLSMDVLLGLQAGLNGIPSWAAPVLLPVVQLIADARFGLDSASLEQGAADATFDLPVLLFHGDADGFVPFDASRALAESSNGSVIWERVPDAGHVRSWNLNPASYETAVTAFLNTVGDR